MSIQHSKQMSMIIDRQVQMGVLHIFAPTLHFAGCKSERWMHRCVDIFCCDGLFQVLRVHSVIKFQGLIDKISLASPLLSTLLDLFILVLSQFFSLLSLTPLFNSLGDEHDRPAYEPVASPAIKIQEMTALIIILFEMLRLEAPG